MNSSDTLRQKAEAFVAENFKGLDDAINDKDISLWYKDLIVESLLDFHKELSPTSVGEEIIDNKKEK